MSYFGSYMGGAASAAPGGVTFGHRFWVHVTQPATVVAEPRLKKAAPTAAPKRATGLVEAGTPRRVVRLPQAVSTDPEQFAVFTGVSRLNIKT